jgi:hypothetical protein
MNNNDGAAMNELRHLWHGVPGFTSDAWHGHLQWSPPVAYGAAILIVVLGVAAWLAVSGRAGLVLALLGAALGMVTAVSQGPAEGPGTLIPRAALHSAPVLILSGSLALGLLLTRNFVVLAGAALLVAVSLNVHAAYAYGTPLILLSAGALAGLVFARGLSAAAVLSGAGVVLVALTRGHEADLPAMLLSGFLLAWLLGTGMKGLIRPTLSGY